MKAYINNFNLLDWPKKLAKDLTKANLEVVIIDNASTYVPLLEWYDECPYEIVKLKENVGYRAPWYAGVVNEKEKYIVTDPDLDISQIPEDWVERLEYYLEKYPKPKIGLAIKLDDLPDDGLLTAWARRVQYIYWQNPIEPDLYDAPVDTTLALYNPKIGGHVGTDGYRLGGSYAMRHLPWYLKSFNTWSNDYKYFYQHCSNCSITVGHLRTIGNKKKIKDIKWLL